MCACAHFICLPPFLPADFKEQAGRTHKRIVIVEDTEISSLKISREIAETDERRGLTSIQNLWKSHKASSSTRAFKTSELIPSFMKQYPISLTLQIQSGSGWDRV
jgi:hypothetical protein